MSQTILVELSEALADAAEQAGRSTVLVNARRRMPASGIAYAPDLVLTADHCIEREEDITVGLADGVQVAAKVAGREAGLDLAVLRITGGVAQPAEVSQSPARVGQLALVLGRPSSGGVQASLGTVSAIGGPIRTGRGGLLERYLRTDGISYPGFSGGPLVAADGTVLGLNTSGLADGAALTIPADLAWRVAATLAAHGRLKHGYLGIRSQAVELSASTQRALQREQAAGLLVVSVEKHSPAARGGLIVGDILLSIAGQPVFQHDELFARLNGDAVGQSQPVEILRGGQPQMMTVTIGERPA